MLLGVKLVPEPRVDGEARVEGDAKVDGEAAAELLVIVLDAPVFLAI